MRHVVRLNLFDIAKIAVVRTVSLIEVCRMKKLSIASELCADFLSQYSYFLSELGMESSILIIRRMIYCNLRQTNQTIDEFSFFSNYSQMKISADINRSIWIYVCCHFD